MRLRQLLTTGLLALTASFVNAQTHESGDANRPTNLKPEIGGVLGLNYNDGVYRSGSGDAGVSVTLPGETVDRQFIGGVTRELGNSDLYHREQKGVKPFLSISPQVEVADGLSVGPIVRAAGGDSDLLTEDLRFVELRANLDVRVGGIVKWNYSPKGELYLTLTIGNGVIKPDSQFSGHVGAGVIHTF